MNTIGSPYSLPLNNKAQKIISQNPLSNHVRIQAQDGDVSYRLDGKMDTVDGFILPQNDVLTLALSGQSIAVWSTAKGVTVRLVIQEIKI